MAYWLPGHTSRRTHSLDAGLYGLFKNYFNSEVHVAQQSHTSAELEQFELLQMIRRVYNRAFTVPNVVKAFQNACLWPLNTEFLLGGPHLKSAEELDVMMDSKALLEMVNGCRELAPRDDNLQLVISHCSTLRTTKGLLVTSEEAMGMIVEEVDKVRAKEGEKQCKGEDPAAQLEFVRLSKRKARMDFAHWAMEHRTRLHGQASVLWRPLEVCIAIAKSRHSNASAGGI